MSRIRVAIILCLLMTSAAEARAEWHIIPFFGSTFATETTLITLDRGGASSQLILGASGAWVTSGVLGFEGDLGFSPRFFERDDPAGLVASSQLVTAFGNVILTVPLSVTRDSLRPYVAGGLGVMYAGSHDQLDVAPLDKTLLGLSVGGGAVGFLTPRTGVRFDLRHVRSVRGDSESLSGTSRARLSFWRATVGVVIRY